VKRALLAGALAVALAGGALLAFVLYREHQSRNVRGSSTVEFVTTQPAAPAKPREPGVVWPTFGYDAARLRVAAGIELRPPFRRVWTFPARALVEFPPVVAYGRLFFATNSGNVYAINARTGKRAWRYLSRRCQAGSPAVRSHLVYVTFLNRPPCNTERKNVDGEVVALYAGSGAVRWRRKIGPSESSPLVANGTVYVGDWRGRVYALSANTGATRWTIQTGGKVKGGVALAGGQLVVGAYDGHLYALDARTGKLRWRASSQQRLGGRATFYSTPALAYGRVYIGSTDGKMYSFGASTGKLRWARGTGGYVYSSPAVWRRRVYAGSYSGRFYAFDAATGDVKWQFDAHGPISGSPTVIRGVVYFATLERKTFALDARSGRLLWTFPDGKYSPVVADKRMLYLIGYARVYGLVER
jgi:outer membrane protein assembly factor BamB